MKFCEDNLDFLHDNHIAVLEPGLFDGEVWVASSSETGEIQAVAVWCPPGIGFWETQVLVPASFPVLISGGVFWFDLGKRNGLWVTTLYSQSSASRIKNGSKRMSVWPKYDGQIREGI